MPIIVIMVNWAKFVGILAIYLFVIPKFLAGTVAKYVLREQSTHAHWNQSSR